MPTAVDAPIEIVKVDEPEPGAAIEVGLKLAVAPDGRPDADSAMEELKLPERLETMVDEPPLPIDELLADDVPTQAQFENMLDPVDAFKRSRQGVFRDVPENDPFDRPYIAPAIDEIVKKEPTEVEQGITTSLPKPRRETPAIR